jgi:diacylglycerol kinase (ATP)
MGCYKQIHQNKGSFSMATAKQLKTYVVQNPVSGLSDAPTIRDKISQVMEENQIPFEIYETTGKEDLYAVIKAAIGRGFERFVSVGGDGTISGVASGLVNTKIPLVIIPTGTVNALARELQIPFTLDEAVRWWSEQNARSKFIDVIEARERYYLLNVSAGAAAKIMKEAKREDIHRFGAVVYLWNALKRFFDVPTHRFRLRVDGKPVSFRASEVMIANSGVLMGLRALQLDPEASLDSGKLTICHAQMQNMLDYVKIAFKIVTTPPEVTPPEVDCIDATREIVIETNSPIPVQGDGEQIGYTPVTVKLMPHALHLVLPPWRESK